MGDRPATALDATDLGSTVVSKDHYDVVRVDLEDGRDYPIYIGTGYSDQEGTEWVHCCGVPRMCLLNLLPGEPYF